MFKYIIKRLLIMIPLVIIISFITFILTHITNEDPAITILHAQEVPHVTPELIAETRAKYGLNDPLLVQYFHWFMDALQFKFGVSYVTGDSVHSRVLPAFINTLKLTMVASVIIILGSIILGVFTAIMRGRFIDRFVRTIAFILTALPTYWVASMLIIYVSVKLNLLPTSGLNGPVSYILPVIVLSLAHIGIYFRNVRSAMIQQLEQDYVTYARACGLDRFTILKRVLRNAMQVAITIFCMSIPTIMSGIVIIEYIFAWPGLGQLSIKAILEQDFPIIQAYVLIIAVLFVLFNTIADVINAILNPQLRGGI